ncbi:MAG: FkbM family methyltransferase [Acetobacteraceae bacterium]|nr:FkbM family methyltransferase [Acetobacteraceae bacterium]
MQKNVFEFLGRRIELWTHPAPDHLAMAIRGTRTFYEIDVLMKCRERFLPGTIIVDAGANIGNHAIFFAAILNAQVEAFEPYPPSHTLLELNIAANGLDGRISAHCCALGDHEGTGTLHSGPPGNLGATRFTSGIGETAVRRLDDYTIPGPVGLMKVDVEGGEIPLLRGAAALIRRWRPDIMIEAGTAPEFRATAAVLLEFGYIAVSRFAMTPTWLFVAADQTNRQRDVLAAL